MKRSNRSCWNLIIVLILLFKCDFIQMLLKLPEDALLNFTGLARKYGHPADVHQVKTQDRYLLELYRLPGKSQIPVLLMHGFEDSSDTWILRGYDSLAISLANAGYDVWLGNTRGNRYSMKHARLHPNDKQYWQFSIHELGYYDLPAIIDKVLLTTKAKKLTAIGHSQGNAIFYILGSCHPQYNDKVNLMIALSPISFIHNTPQPVSAYLHIAPSIRKKLNILGIYDLLRYDGIVSKYIRRFCSVAWIGYEICANSVLFPIIGYDPSELEPVFFQVLINHLPAGTSLMDYEHFGQIAVSKRFAHFDYGAIENLIKYNSTKPPAYDLKKVTMPVALFAGKNDPLSDLEDVKLLEKRLPHLVELFVNPRSEFSHGDCVWGKNMKEYLFPHIFELLKRYNNQPIKRQT